MKLNIPFKYQNLRKINKGLTNDNYLIEINEQTHIVRVPKADTKHLFKRANEAEILQKLQNCDFILPTIHYHNGLQIAKYEENLINFDEYKHHDKLKKVAQLMNKLHNSKVEVTSTFNPNAQIKLYYENIKNKPFNLDKYAHLMSELEAHEFQPVLCHNDWVNGNICYVNNQVFLIDFEYAGMNDRYFDIMSFITENSLSKNEEAEFLAIIFKGKITQEDQRILEMYRNINNLLWYLWALMMHEFRSEVIYQEIADIKLAQLNA